MQDQYAIGVGARQRFGPGLGSAVEIGKHEPIDRRFRLVRHSAQIAGGSGTAPHRRRRHELANVRQRPTVLRMLEESVVLESNPLLHGRRRALHELELER